MTSDFLSRWSRRKIRARQAEKTQRAVRDPEESGERTETRTGIDPRAAAPARTHDEAAPAGSAQGQPEPNADGLLATDALNCLASDFLAFFSPEVDESLKRAALKKLFADPHFNVMDGLDVYVDDYSKPVALSAAAAAASHGFRFMRSALAESAGEPGRDGERPAQRAGDAPDAPGIVAAAVTDVDSNGSTGPRNSARTDPRTH